MTTSIEEAERLLAANNIVGIDVSWFASIVGQARALEAKGNNANQAFYEFNGKQKWESAKGRAIEIAICHVFGLDRDAPGYVHPGWMKWSETEKAAKPKKKAVVLRGHRTRPRAIEALWPELVYFGSGTLFFGMPGVGKSTIVNEIAARVSRGGAMPGEPEDTEHDPRSVVILTAEDSPEEVIVPQLKAAGAWLENIFIVPSATIGEGEHTSIDLAADLEMVEELMEKEGLLERDETDSCPVGLVVISPVTAYLGTKADSNSMTAVRAVLDPFFAMLRRHKVACINIGHPKKGTGDEIAMYQNAGSVAWVAAHRVVVMAMSDPDQNRDGPRLFLRAKNNLAEGVPYGFAYKIVGASADFGKDGQFSTFRVEWVGRDDRDPDEVLERMKKKKKKGETKRDKAEKLLRRELADGREVRAANLQALAKDEGIGEATLNAARRDIGVQSEKKGAEFWCRMPGPAEQGSMPF